MILGIDLGTTNSLVAVLRDGEPATLENELGDHLTPSAVAIAEDGSLLVGRPARDRLVVDPDAGRAFFKRDMGTERRYRFGGREWSPIECSAAILRELHRTAKRHLGACDQAVISVPAYFHDTQRQATVEAARIAGLSVARIINEPTAAALAYGYSRADEEAHLMVFDLGGGTFDVSILEVFESVIEVQASSGDSMLGGEDYTDALLEVAIARAGNKPGRRERARLRQSIEVAKRELSRGMQAEIRIAGRTVELRREDLQEAGKEITGRMRPILLRCLRDAGLEPSRLRDCLLVGGATRMPLVEAVLRDAIGVAPNRSVDADRAVALGAAVQAAACERNEAVRDLVLTDVCPHTLGTEVVKDYGADEYEEGFFLPILDRNITIPASRAVPLRTLHPKQNVLRVGIYQGESRHVKDNTFLGELSVRGVRHRPGQRYPGQVEVRYSYDMNGILEVEVTVMETGKTHTKVLESRPGQLSKKQLQEAIRRLQSIKVRPRDLLPNRARIERANRLFRELTGTARSQLTHLLDGFEEALRAEEPNEIAMSGARLDEFVDPFYRDEGERQPERP